MEENKSISNFISLIKDFKYTLWDIDEEVFSTDLVTITLNGMQDEYQMFIIGLTKGEKDPTFYHLESIFMQ